MLLLYLYQKIIFYLSLVAMKDEVTISKIMFFRAKAHPFLFSL